MLFFFFFANLAEILSVRILKKGNIRNFVLFVLHFSRRHLKVSVSLKGLEFVVNVLFFGAKFIARLAYVIIITSITG